VLSRLGTRFGGNGTPDFVLPDRPTGSDGITYATVVDGLYAARD
jgi:hypothetical protein